MILLELFLAFLEVGCFSFGGGYAAVALIREVVIARGWMTEEMLSYIIAVSESTPGPIMVNLATYVGSTQAGVPGALIATFAVVLPAFCIILGVMAVMKRFLGNPWVAAAMTGLKACIAGIILAVGCSMVWENCLPGAALDLRAVLLSLVLGTMYFGAQPVCKKKISPISLILIAATLGVFVYGI